MKPRIGRQRIVLIIVVLLLVGVGAFVWIGQLTSRGAEPYYSGQIEAVQSELAFQVAGRVATVNVREGAKVEKGQVLAAIDPSDYLSRLVEARANLDRAIRSRQQLETSLAISKKTLPDDVVRARAAVQVTQDTLDKALRNRDRYEHLFKQGVVSEREWDNVRLEYETSRSRYTEAEAALEQAKSNLSKVDVLNNEIDAASAQVKSLQASEGYSELQLQYTELKAPYAGVIISRNIEPGEVVAPGRQALTIADLSRVDLKIFVPETEIGRVKPGQPVDVKIDTFPGKVFKGNVTFVSPEGEFTPKIIQTQKERVKIVYLVKVSVANPDLELKTGMPADAWLR